MKRWSTLWLTPLVAATALLPSCRRAPAGDQSDRQPVAVPVAAQPARTSTMRAVIQASGVIVPAEGAEFLLVAPETARLIEVAKSVGDAVASGDVLVRFELTGAVQDVARQRAELARAQAQVENARAGESRTRDLVARGLIPRNDINTAERELADAQQAFDRATIVFKSAEAGAGRAVVRAPFAGVVAARLHNPGDLVQPAATDPILRIVDPARVEVIASVAAVEAPRVLPGATARMSNPGGGSSLRLTVAGRSPVNAATGMASVRLVPAEPVKASVDTAVAVEIDAEERAGVVFVTPDVIVTDDGGMAVMIANGDRAERRPITTGITTDGGIEVTSGIRPGELLITQGQIGLADGAVISVVVR